MVGVCRCSAWTYRKIKRSQSIVKQVFAPCWRTYNFKEMMMFSGMRSRKPEPNPYSKTCNIENDVAKELARDVHIRFMMTSTEIDACETKKDIERMVDVYIDGIKTVMLSRIFMKHPRFLVAENE